jgi:hypothetical protein
VAHCRRGAGDVLGAVGPLGSGVMDFVKTPVIALFQGTSLHSLAASHTSTKFFCVAELFALFDEGLRAKLAHLDTTCQVSIR